MLALVVATQLALQPEKPKRRGSLCSTVDECLAANLWHLPGPNPIISPWEPNGAKAWMSFECEVAGGVQQVNATHYVFVFHCLNDKGYQVGMSTATHPLGPWSVVCGAWPRTPAWARRQLHHRCRQLPPGRQNPDNRR